MHGSQVVSQSPNARSSHLYAATEADCMQVRIHSCPDPGIEDRFSMDLPFSTPHQWFIFILLHASHLTSMSPAFSSSAHYRNLENSAAPRWFGRCACRSLPRGHPIFQGFPHRLCTFSWRTIPLRLMFVYLPYRDSFVFLYTMRTLNSPSFYQDPSLIARVLNPS